MRTQVKSVHKHNCEERYRTSVILQKAWSQKWKSACSICDARGVRIYEEDPGERGISLRPGKMSFEEPCSCVEDGLCPRCGGQQELSWCLDGQKDPCKRCGWNWGIVPEDAVKQAEYQTTLSRDITISDFRPELYWCECELEAGP